MNKFVYIIFSIIMTHTINIITLSNNNYPGFLCVIEGIDGSGKTTLLKNLEQLFAKEKFNVFFTKQPGGTQVGKQLRTIILDKEISVCPFTEFLLFAADRAQHFQEFIIPKLATGDLIISDRMADSSLVYQGYLKGIELHKIHTINAWCMQNIQPDIIFYLQINSHDAKQRIKKTRGFNDKFEEELIEHLDKLAQAFDTIFQNRNNVIIVDALENPETIAHFVYKKIIDLYRTKQKNYV